MAMKPPSISDLLSLSVADRLRLVEDPWDSIAEVPELIQLTDVQREELERRLEAYHANPSGGSAWSDVKKHITKSE